MHQRSQIPRTDACYDRGGPLFFLILPLNLGAQDLSKAKTDLEKNQNCYRMKKSHGLGTQRESGGGECRISDNFGLRSPVIQEPFEQKSAAFVVARVHIEITGMSNTAATESNRKKILTPVRTTSISSGWSVVGHRCPFEVFSSWSYWTG